MQVHWKCIWPCRTYCSLSCPFYLGVLLFWNLMVAKYLHASVSFFIFQIWSGSKIYHTHNVNRKLTILVYYTFLATLHRRCIPKLASHTPHLNNKHKRAALVPPHHTHTLCSETHFSTPASSLNKHDRQTCSTHPNPALFNVCNYANLWRRLPVETKY